MNLSNVDTGLFTQNCIPFICNVAVGGIQLMKPLLLHASSKATSQKHRRIIHLEFNSTELSGGLEWAERMEVGML
jgi:hypothetical protein